MTKEKEVVSDGWDFSADDKAEAQWAKFDKIGVRYSGIVEEVYEKPGQDAFPAQRVFVLKQSDGEIINVGISMNKDYVIQRTNRVQPGDKLGFEYTKDIPASTKGYAPAKSIEVYWRQAEVVKPVEKVLDKDFN